MERDGQLYDGAGDTQFILCRDFGPFYPLDHGDSSSNFSEWSTYIDKQLRSQHKIILKSQGLRFRGELRQEYCSEE
jgi:hypothetical protein